MFPPHDKAACPGIQRFGTHKSASLKLSIERRNPNGLNSKLLKPQNSMQ
jgi:hypothetical protein